MVEQSRSQFAAIRGNKSSDLGGYDVTFALPDSWYCAVLEDAEKWSYRYVWKYPHGDERAHQAFLNIAEELRTCIGNIAEERVDQSVNHPDFYASHYFQLPGSAASVNLKNKAKLMSTLVSIRVDEFTETQ